MAFVAAAPLATAAVASLVTGIAGAGVTAYGMYEQGKARAEAEAASSKLAIYQAQVAENNAKIAEQNAAYARQAGLAEAQAQSMKGAEQIAAIKAAQAASGIDVNIGSAVDVRVGQTELNRLDTENILQRADLAAYGYRTQATNALAEARLRRQSARYGVSAAGEAMTGGEIGAAGSLLENASALGFKWTGMQSESAPLTGWDATVTVG